MRRFIVLLSAMIFISISARSQGYRYKSKPDKLKIDFGPDANISLGDNATFYPFGFGLTGRICYNVTDHVQLNAMTGFLMFLGTQYSSVQYPNEAYFPFRGGVSYLPSPRFHLDGNIGSGTYLASGSTATGFGFSFGLGYTIADRIDFSMRYEGVSSNGTLSYIGSRLAYRIIK